MYRISYFGLTFNFEFHLIQLYKLQQPVYHQINEGKILS